MSIRRINTREKLADWDECPACDGKGKDGSCKTCKNSGNPGFILIPRSNFN